MPNKYAHFARLAQKARHKAKSCERKKPFETEEEAAETGNSTYKCRYCHKWHTSGARAKFINSMVKRASRDPRISKDSSSTPSR